ncbi:hypothetical protein [Pseudomonas qingdaonensis]|uniref:hypothetical protein n=1 Tax=Pseudomonas qingdaonensis TaxID=2056231 RepID=UPI001F40A97B|nr:hypothetical protein [Pseudomonas qingdaonensis]
MSELAQALLQAVPEDVSSIGNQALHERLTQLHDTLLPRLISGKLRLPEAESLLESTL